MLCKPCCLACITLAYACVQVHTAESFSANWSSSGVIPMTGSQLSAGGAPLDAAATVAGGLRVLLRAALGDDLTIVNIASDASGAVPYLDTNIASLVLQCCPLRCPLPPVCYSP